MSAAPWARHVKQFKIRVRASALWGVVQTRRLVGVRFRPVPPVTQAVQTILEEVVAFQGMHATMLDVS
jgi:hypothetical protein